MTLTKPLGNNILIEVQRHDDGVSRSDETESMNFGKVIKTSIGAYHLTASSAIHFEEAFIEATGKQLEHMIGSTVRWEEFAEGGQTFEEDGKTYALIPWWRLISYEEN